VGAGANPLTPHRARARDLGSSEEAYGAAQCFQASRVAEARRLYSWASIRSRANVVPRRWHSCSGVRGDLREFSTACCSAASVLRRAKSQRRRSVSGWRAPVAATTGTSAWSPWRGRPCEAHSPISWCTPIIKSYQNGKKGLLVNRTDGTTTENWWFLSLSLSLSLSLFVVPLLAENYAPARPGVARPRTRGTSQRQSGVSCARGVKKIPQGSELRRWLYSSS
jgi:hypothetical protein